MTQESRKGRREEFLPPREEQNDLFDRSIDRSIMSAMTNTGENGVDACDGADRISDLQDSVKRIEVGGVGLGQVGGKGWEGVGARSTR